MDGSLGGEAGQLAWPRALRLDLSCSWRHAEMADCPLYAGRTRPGRRRSSSFPLSCPALTRSPRPPPAAPALRRLAPHQTCPAAAPAAPPALRGGGYGAPAATLHPRRGPGRRQGSPPSSENGRCVTLARGVGPARLAAGRGPRHSGTVAALTSVHAPPSLGS